MTSYDALVQVRFGHVDPAGIAYFPRIFDYIHEVFEEVWEEHVGVRYDRLLHGERMGFPLVHSEVDFRRPLRFGNRLVVRVTCFKLGHSSLGLRYRFVLDDEVHVEARMVTACVRTDTMRACPIPDAFRQRFASLLEPDARSAQEGTQP